MLAEPGYLSADEARAWQSRYRSMMSGPRYLWLATKAGFEAQHVDGPDDHAARDFLVGERIVPFFASHSDNPYHCPGATYSAPAGAGDRRLRTRSPVTTRMCHSTTCAPRRSRSRRPSCSSPGRVIPGSVPSCSGGTRPGIPEPAWRSSRRLGTTCSGTDQTLPSRPFASSLLLADEPGRATTGPTCPPRAPVGSGRYQSPAAAPPSLHTSERDEMYRELEAHARQQRHPRLALRGGRDDSGGVLQSGRCSRQTIIAIEQGRYWPHSKSPQESPCALGVVASTVSSATPNDSEISLTRG